MTTPSRRQELEEVIGSRLYSRPVAGRIGELPRLEKALLFAELSNIVYLRENLAAECAALLGLARYTYLDNDGSQAFIFENDEDCILVCRGTEPNDWNDIKADIDAASVVAETVGRVHRGFKTEVDDLWPQIEALLINNNKKLWIAGHSLGAAMATICASRCRLAHINTSPIEVYTYGSPRVGNNSYVNHAFLRHYRWVNNNDIVTRVPPTWLGYKHTGREQYMNAYGKMREMTAWQRTKDRWRGLWFGVKRGKIDAFSDHIMDRYIENIYGAIQERDRERTPGAKDLVV